MLLSEAFEAYRRDYIVFNHQSRKTEESHCGAAAAMLSFLGDMSVEDLEFQHIRDWKESLEKRMSTNSSRLYIIKLRNVLRFLRVRGVKCMSEDSITVPKRQTVPIDFLTTEEVTALIGAVRPGQHGYTKINALKNVAIISLLYASGLRVSELCSLNRSDMRVRGSFTVVGKGDKPRLCFYDERSDAAVRLYLESRNDTNPALFICEQTGERITPGMVQMIFRTASRRAGFTRTIHPHVMRHSFATNLLRNNTNLFYVSKFLGHSSVQTTEMYTHYVNEDLRRIYGENHTF